MSSVGRIDLDLNINNRGFDKQVDQIASRTKQKFNVMSVAVGNILADMATKAIASIGSFVKDSIDKGSELAELQNVVDTVFTTMSDTVDNFAQNALEAYGLTEAQAKRMMGTYGAMSKAFGYTEQQAYSMSEQLTALTADVASFYNLNHDEAYTKMKSVFTGETESLKELGVVMTQAALDQYALQQGYGRTTAQMTEQEKVALRLAFVQDKLSVASGDFARTQNQWANQSRILAGQFESLKAAIGQGLINVLTPVIRVINIIMGKLVQLANAFKSFTAMIMGGSSGGGGKTAAGAMEGVADAAEQAAVATGGISDAAGGAAASAKKAQKALMGFDEINKLQDTSSSGGGGGGGGGGAGGGVSFDDIDFGGAMEEQQSKMEDALDKLKEKAKQVFAIFEDGFKEGLGDDFDASLQRISNHLQGIKDSIVDIFTDPEVQGAATNWAVTVIHSLGQITGSVVSIAQSIAENLIGGVDLYLKQNSGYIKNRIIGMFNVSADIWEIAGDFSVALASIFEVFRGPEAKQCTANIIGIFSNAFLGATQLAMQVGRDILNCITQPIIDNKDAIAQAISNILGPVSSVLGTLNNSVKETFEKIFDVYDTSIKPMFEKFANGLSSIVSTLLDTFNTYIAPILDAWATKFSEVFEQHIQPLINDLIEFIGKLADAIGDIWEGALVPFINWVISTIVPAVAPVIKEVGEIVMDLVGVIADVIDGIIEVLGGIIDFIAGVFTGDWDRCWKGIQSIFEGIWTAISGFLSGIWEVIKGIVSAALEAIKGIIEVALSLISGIIQTAWNLIKNIFKTVLGAIQTLVSTVFNAIKTSIQTIMNAIKTVVTTMWNAIKTVVSTVLNAIKTVVTTVWNAIKSVVTTVMNAIKSALTTAWNAIKSSVTTVVNSIKSAVSGAWNAIKSSVTGAVNTIKSGVTTGFNAMKSAISNVMDSIKSKIQGVFNGIWSFIKGIINSILGGIESLVNGLISAVNGMVRAMNKLSFDVPDWVPGMGGKKFGFNLSEVSKISVPRLAEGGYVRANQPQLAMIGDNKTQGEIVSPEGKMMEIMMQALEAFFGKLRDIGYSNQQQQGDFGDLVIPIYLDGTILDEVIVTAQQRRNVRSGGR